MTLEATSLISRYIATTRFDDLPGDVVEQAKRQILDTLGVAWAGSNAADCDIAYDLSKEQGGKPEASVWVQGDRLPVASATFVNSLYASALDFDSFHEASELHADIVVLPAAMAMAERQRTDGRDFLAAFIVASDLACRIGMSMNMRAGWFDTSVLGVFGAAAATLRLAGADAMATRNGLGLAFLNAAGTYQAAIERSLAKRMESAFAARAGIQCGLLGSRGYNGPGDFLHGRFGLYAMYGDGDGDVLLSDLGRRYMLGGTTLKRYPSCACSHAATAAILTLNKTHKVAAADVAEAEVVLSPYMNTLVGAPFAPGENPQVAAQFSVRYAVACAILFGQFGLDELREDRIFDPRVADLAGRVRVRVDETSAAIMTPATVHVRTRTGRELTETTTVLPGMPESPFDLATVKVKFAECTSRGVRPLDPACRDRFAERVMGLESVTDMSRFFDGILHPPS